MKNLSPPGSYITKVEIDELFGETDIRIAIDPLADPRLLIIYGQNGSGKTTILEIIRSLLSHDDNAGHRTHLSKIPFSRAAVTLSGDVVVEAKKREGLIGAYDWIIRRSNAEPMYLHLKPLHGKIIADGWDAPQQRRHNEMLIELQSLIRRVVSLDDKRTFYVPEQRGGRIIERRLSDGRTIQEFATDELQEDDNDPVYLGLNEIVSSVRREALLLSNRGNQGAQSIYTSLVNKIVFSAKADASPVDSIKDLTTQLLETQSRSEVLSAYGLAAPIQHQPMVDALEKVDESREDVVANIVTPYIESLSARLNSIQSLHDSLHHWIESLNDFFKPKTIKFKVGEEIQIRSRGGRLLPAKDLSSGERHLLLLMTRAFQLRTSGGLMLVDEPELSLNSVWQRGLVHSMLESFGGGGCQLVVASHSLEIAAKYEANVVAVS